MVQPGDTLSIISKQTGVPVGTLKSLNNISGFLIKVGQELRIAP
ncbi:LysM peptidoglycan-binding domain-containing protein [Thermodesulfobacteriota bacterium]